MSERTRTRIGFAVALLAMASLGACSRADGDPNATADATNRNANAQSDQARAAAEGKKIGHVLPFRICRLAVNDNFTNGYTLEQAEIRVSASAKPEDWFATTASAAQYLADAGVAEAIELDVTRDDLPTEGVAGMYAWLGKVNIGRDASQSNARKLPYDWTAFTPILTSAERAAPLDSAAIRDAFDELPQRLQEDDKVNEAAARIKKRLGLKYVPDLSFAGPVFSGNAMADRKLSDYYIEAGADSIKQLEHLKDLARGAPAHNLECPDWHL
ncbi:MULTISPECIES: hypothetical protein [unclassified Caballeronia]|uniref:hypothetical protein n=1 Tax=unclassified Caballeronia TaxID=2646786 RepID=UPI00286169CD|nr:MULTISPECIES: hypothetical protein [unclassified Caballeronia]MDR5754879.1 hypothetical protein [Caballeronia sp. LZ024]MDR5845439.1 hypothetical protein [Caballeronia sp. LZ031]